MTATDADAFVTQLVEETEPAARRDRLVATLWRTPPWSGLHTMGRALFERLVTDHGDDLAAHSAQNTLALSAFARLMVAERNHGVAKEVATTAGRAADRADDPALTRLVRALAIRTALGQGRLTWALEEARTRWAYLDDEPPVMVVEQKLSLGLASIVGGDLDRAATHFAAVEDLVGRHDAHALGAWQRCRAHLGAAHVALRRSRPMDSWEAARRAQHLIEAAPAPIEAVEVALLVNALGLLAGQPMETPRVLATLQAAAEQPALPGVDFLSGLPAPLTGATPDALARRLAAAAGQRATAADPHGWLLAILLSAVCRGDDVEGAARVLKTARAGLDGPRSAAIQRLLDGAIEAVR